MINIKTLRVEAVKEFALAHYEDGGWDIVVETMDDEIIYDIVKMSRTPRGAVKKMASYIGAIDDYRSEIVSA